ncbi:hypothetical protein EV174_003755, partial [Coemansia sp. RSA 2320]
PSTAMPWSHRHAEEDNSESETRVSRTHSRKGSLGLDLRQNIKSVGSLQTEAGLVLPSPTVPDEMFFDDSMPPARVYTRLPERAPQLDFSLNFEPVSQNSYALNPAFGYSWKMAPAPPVPQIPKGFTGSYVTKVNLLPPTENKITFPRPDSDNFQEDVVLTGETLNDEGIGQHALQQPLSAKEAQSRRPLKEQVRSYRSGSSHQQVPFGKRNYSLPAALAPPAPRMELENYEFSSIDRLERKWADVKTESTRMLSSAIYKYYFNHGEWSDFEQVFPTKVLEVWEEFQGKLSSAELAFVNTILVSQNPFSMSEGGQEKHIPVLARTIPLSQAVRTMVYSEDMRSRESYSSLGGSGPEIDPEFADWLITHFNTMKSATFSPIDATFGDKHHAQSLQEPPKPEALRAAAEKRLSRRFVAPSAAASMASLIDPAKLQAKAAKSEKPRRKKASGDRSVSESARPSSKRFSSKRPVAFEPMPQTPAQPHPHTPLPPPARETVAQVPALCATELNLPPPSPVERYDRLATPAPIPIPVPVSRSGSKSRRHTHNFFSSRSLEFRVSTDSLNSVCRVPREFQMKDLPPLPPNAAEISIISKQNITGGGLKDSLVAAPVKRENTLVKKSGMLAHFSSHLELNRKAAVMAAEPEKPRSSSMTVEISESEKTRPSTARSTFAEVRVTKASKARASMAKEPVVMLYDWRPAPADGDTDWGFRISSLAFHQPVVRRKSSLPAFVVHANMPTLNRRELPDPQKTSTRPGTASKRKSVKSTIAPMANSTAELPPELSSLPPPPTQAPPPAPNALPPDAQQPEQPLAQPHTPRAPLQSQPSQSRSKKSQDGMDQKATKSPAHLGLSFPGHTKDHNANSGANTGVRGVLYELAYLSTQGKNVWSKGEHIFAKMWKTGLEVNRIAEQDFYDFCVDELLKASSDAFQDLQAMGSKSAAKKLYESFNAKLTVLLTDATI